jgi:hypothetical protein
MQLNHRLFFSLVCISTLSIGSIDFNRSSEALSIAITKPVQCSNKDIVGSNQLERFSGFPSNRSKYIYNVLPYRVSAGAYYVPIKNGKYCMMDDGGEKKDLRAAVKKFTAIYGSQPLGVCDATQSGRVKFTCKSTSAALKERI